MVLAYRQIKETLDMLKKGQLDSKSKRPCRKNWHISNQMPYIKYSTLYHGFKSVPRKKDTFKNHTLIIFFDPLLERTEVHGGNARQ